MNSYPDAVAKIAGDYLERVKGQLRLAPVREREEFLREIESHVYEAYQEMPVEDEVERILAVLRNLGEPAEVVADRLPGAMLRSGMKRNLPLYVTGGILLALFGIPLGFGGIGVLVGVVGALAGLLVAYFATAGSVTLVGALFLLLGLTRFLTPHFWDRLVAVGIIQMDGPFGEIFEHIPASEQGILMIAAASVMVAAGLGMLWVGKHMFRGLRFLVSLGVEWMRRTAQGLRRKLQREERGGVRAKGEWAGATRG